MIQEDSLAFINPNKIEGSIESILKENFPRYIVFRNAYLYPLTEKQKGLSNWRYDTHPNLERIGMASYGILKSLNFIDKRKNSIIISDSEQSFKNIYFHFGLIFDTIESLSRSIIKIEQLLELTDFKEKSKITKEKLIKEFNDWVDGKHDREFNNFEEYGKPIIYYPYKNKHYLGLILADPLKKKYNKFIEDIKKYRDQLIHNPAIDVFKSGNNLYTIKKEFVIKTRNWADIQILFERKKEWFTNPIEMVEDDLTTLLTYFNDIWKFFLIEMEKIYAHHKFNSIFREYKREI